jgi:hypothetical protein
MAENPGNFILNNYKQAVTMILEYVIELEAFACTFGFQAQDFESWHAEEFEYLKNLMHEPGEDILNISYVEALQGLKHAE